MVLKIVKKKLKSDVINLDMFKKYRRELDEIDKISGGRTKGSYNIKDKQFRLILKDINKGIEQLVLDGLHFRLPFGLGTIHITRNKPKRVFNDDGTLNMKKVPINYKETNDLWKRDPDAKQKKTLVYHTNEYIYHIRWYKRNPIVTNIKLYNFLPARSMRRRLAKKIKTEPELTYFDLNQRY